jgi:hypothetical protein
MKNTPKFRDPSMVAKIADLEPGWASAADIAWSLTEDDDSSYEARSRVKTALGDLYRAGVIERLYVRHKDAPMACYLIDPAKLADALAESR